MLMVSSQLSYDYVENTHSNTQSVPTYFPFLGQGLKKVGCDAQNCYFKTHPFGLELIWQYLNMLLKNMRCLRCKINITKTVTRSDSVFSQTV